MKKVISTLAFVAVFSISMNAQEETKQKSKEVAKTEVKSTKKECSKDEKKGASCCMAKKGAKA